MFPGCVQSSTLILGVALKPHNCRWWTAILISYPWKGHFAIDSDMCEALCSHKIAAQQISIAPSGQLSYPWHCRNGHSIFSGNYPLLGIQYFWATILSLALPKWASDIFRQLSYPWHCQNGVSIICKCLSHHPEERPLFKCRNYKNIPGSFLNTAMHRSGGVVVDGAMQWLI